MQDRNVSDDDVAAQFQADRFISPAGLDRVTRVWITEWPGPRIGGGSAQSIVLGFRT